MKKRKICVVTGSRAEYGLLHCLMKEIRKDRSFHLQVIVTGTHLSAVFGSTYRDIERNGFKIARKIPILTSDNSATGVTQALGKAVIGYAKAFKDLKPDWLVVLGDRYEILAAVEAALIAKVPVAHLAGGDITEGAIDDSIRHAITKMSHLHFATHAAAARRIRQLGEDPKTVFCPGHIGLDAIRLLKPESRRDLERDLRFRFRERNLLVTFHPVTLDPVPSMEQLEELLAALHGLKRDMGLIFTASNADADGSKMNLRIRRFVERHPNACFIHSLGQRRYLSTLRYVDAVVGNSSSGIYEAPSFRIPTINIGSRQEGRVQAKSVINCLAKRVFIQRAIEKAFLMDCSRVVNPYGDGRATARIIRSIKSIRDPKSLLKKKFRSL
ncbi:MAG TPA: UDP-N-acetylglucosamine 2-epimerase [Candidatus Omnitrophota bacterium]|nr:UDP-N-acetylglucosamine 2-epimerase [Candidatus Omnitrophota bacterium]